MMVCKFKLLYKNEMVELDVDEVQELLNQLQEDIKILTELLSTQSYKM